MNYREDSADNLFRRLASEMSTGLRPFHRLPPELSAAEGARIRLAAVEQLTNTRLTNVGRHCLDAAHVERHNCENLLGAIQIPLGLAGPLRVNGTHCKDTLFVPLATSEGALIASINRGCSAIAKAGGVTVHVEDIGITRGPVFRTTGISESMKFIEWIAGNFDQIRSIAESTSRHLTLRDLRPFTFGSTVFVRFRFGTESAMGMNMATIACEKVISEFIEPSTNVTCVALSGNYCVDKKASGLNFMEGRGFVVRAECLVSGRLLREVLRCDASSLIEVGYRKNLLGSIASNTIGFNTHHANMVAAFFLATGQDAAQIGEASIGGTCIEAAAEEGVLFSIYLPDVPLGTVGGGTGLATQKEVLRVLGIDESVTLMESTARLAEILGGIVLAGEMSTLAALASRELARSHQRLARGMNYSRPDNGPESP